MPPLKRRTFQRVPRTKAHASLETRQLVDYLDAMQPGDKVSYADLSALIGLDVQERRDLLATARRIVLKTCGKVFDVETSIGLICLHDPGKIGLADNRTQRVARASAKTQEILTTVEIAALTPTDKHRWLALQSVTAAVQVLTHPKTLTQVAAGQPLPALPWNAEVHAHVFG